MRSLLVLSLLTASCFRPQIPSGKVSCRMTSDCPSGMTCQSAGDRSLCCDQRGCPGTAPPPTVDAARSDDVIPSPVDGPPRPSPDLAIADGPRMIIDVPAAVDTVVVVPPIDGPPDGPGVAALVSCARPLDAAPPVAAGRKFYCSIGVQDTRVVMNVDAIDGGDPLTISSFQICQVALDLSAKAPGPPLPAGSLSAADISLLSDIVQYYQGLCTKLPVDQIAGAYATAWARQVTNTAQVQAMVKSRSGLDLEVLTPDQEITQRYLGAARNRRGYLAVHSHGPDLQVSLWPRANAGPTEIPIPTSMRVADDRFFGNSNFTNYLQARTAYQDAISNDLGNLLGEWRVQMTRGGLVDNLILDPDDATFVLAFNGDLRSNNNNWDDAESFKAKRAEAQMNVMMTDYGWGHGVVPADEIGRFASSIFGGQFGQLRGEPIKSTYGLQVMALTGFLNVFREGVPISEVGVVTVNASYGFVFRKLFSPQ